MAPSPDLDPSVVALDLSAAGQLSVAGVLARLDSGVPGLSGEQARARLAAGGPNLIAQHRVTAFGVLIAQLRNPLLGLLLAAAAVSGFTGDPTGAAIIAVIVALSVGLGFVNEYRSARAIAELHGDIHYETLVWRDTTPQRMDVTELVAGDVIALGVGDVVPADLRVIEANGLECDESVLTGESAAASKTAEPAASTDSAVDLPSCAFMGTIVHQGSGRGVIVATGSATAFAGSPPGWVSDRPKRPSRWGCASSPPSWSRSPRCSRLASSSSTSPSIDR